MLKLIPLALVAALAPRRMAEASQAAEAAKVKFASKEYDLDTGDYEITFGDGTVLQTKVDELPDDIKRQLMFHGFGQKVGDSYAGAKGDYAKAKASAQEVIEQLKAGEWRAGRDGESKPRLGELSAAIARIKGITLEDATAAVNAANESGEEGAAKIKTWRAHPKIKAAIAAIRAEKAQAELEAAGDQGGEIEV